MALVLLALLLECGACLFSSPAHSLTEPTSRVGHIDMTEHGELLVLRDSSRAYLYTNNGSHFLKKSNFFLNYQSESLDITADGKWLLAVNSS